MIETLAHKGWHKVQFDRGTIALTEDNCIQLNYEKKEGWTTWDVFTEMELEAYNMGLNMHNKYNLEANMDYIEAYDFEDIRRLFSDE